MLITYARAEEMEAEDGLTRPWSQVEWIHMSEVGVR